MIPVSCPVLGTLAISGIGMTLLSALGFLPALLTRREGITQNLARSNR
ncbi:MAG: hypothetical protein SH809_13930 [Rhodothermales bacterium]|nr:hypothetical protein [Rhodothermales bacterium]